MPTFLLHEDIYSQCLHFIEPLDIAVGHDMTTVQQREPFICLCLAESVVLWLLSWSWQVAQYFYYQVVSSVSLLPS